MINWLLEKLLARQERKQRKEPNSHSGKWSSIRDDSYVGKDSLNITLYTVNGGYIIKFVRYNDDDLHGKDYENTYILDKSADFTKSLSEFIMLETLKK